MSRCPACRAYSGSTWKQIHSRVAGSSSNRPPSATPSSSGCVASTSRRAPTDRAQPLGQLLGGDVVGARTSGRRRPRPTGRRRSSRPRLVDLLAEEAPDEPALLHVQQWRQQLDRRPPRRHPRRPLLVVRQREHAVDQLARGTQSRYAGPAALRRRRAGRARRVAAIRRSSVTSSIRLPSVVPVRLDLLGRLHPRRLAGHLGVVRREVHLAARAAPPTARAAARGSTPSSSIAAHGSPSAAAARAR